MLAEKTRLVLAECLSLGFVNPAQLGALAKSRPVNKAAMQLADPAMVNAEPAARDNRPIAHWQIAESAQM